MAKRFFEVNYYYFYICRLHIYKLWDDDDDDDGNDGQYQSDWFVDHNHHHHRQQQQKSCFSFQTKREREREREGILNQMCLLCKHSILTIVLPPVMNLND